VLAGTRPPTRTRCRRDDCVLVQVLGQRRRKRQSVEERLLSRWSVVTNSLKTPMRISSSQISLGATHTQSSTESRQERLVAWVGDRPVASAPAQGSASSQASASPQASAPSRPVVSPKSSVEASGAHDCKRATQHEQDDEIANSDRHTLELELMVRMFGGDARDARRIAKGVRDIRDSFRAPSDSFAQSAPVAAPPAVPPAPARKGWGLEYDLHVVRTDAELTHFEASGTVNTADGKTIDVAAVMNLSSVRTSKVDVTLRQGDAKKVDPLVLNEGAQAPTFDGRQSFDLNADGKVDDLARLSGGASYLALDANGNGRIDDGSELFGPTRGDGFAELAQHDGDGNGWIDENDAVYDRLRLWQPGAGEKDPGKLTSLRDAGVGALYLGNVATPYTIRSGNGAVAEVAATGLYLKESGQAGTIQHVDLIA